ncbi:DUF2955 domain-containing protein [Parasedimentitalea psychrophila]|uniref:DUF2955 domain-containing protein n=1 Tax=Parasedimentitalea psychrophila TaxID=2997337 RepID=UPI0022EB81A3|nr:DUF2955 domain-containing protein [Parasedimentitalea psychrophila]
MRTEDQRSVIRLTLGTTGVFTLGLALGWPLASIGAVFTALFLQAPAGLTLRASGILFAFGLAVMLFSWLLSSILVPYPVVYLAAVCIAIVMSFAWSLSGAGLLPGVLALMAAMMVPNLVLQSRDLALVLAGWIPVNLLIAGFTSGLMFTLFPAKPQAASQKTKQPAPEFDTGRRMLRMSLVTVPFAFVFFVSGGTALLVLFFVALLSQQLAAMPAAGKNVAKAMLTANMLGAGVAILCFEINVLAPSIVTPALLCLLLCLSLGRLGKSSNRLAPAAGSAITTALIIYGGSIAPFSDEADVKSVTRVLQIASALFFVILAYVVVDEFWPEKERQKA